MHAGEVEAHFRQADGGYRFARWGRPIVPVVFGVEEATLAVVKGAIEAVVALAGHKMAETDPELGANLMLFFLRDWDELLAVPGLAGMLGDMAALVARLKARRANQYRSFRFDEAGAIKACFAFVRIDAALAGLPADVLALEQAVRAILAWGEGAFAARAALAEVQGTAVLRPEVAALIRAAYDPVLPDATRDPSHALRLAARLG
ncbi:MAG: DUF2927 domain-containing protein [Rhodobacteraceae bacterium]|nr:DUF2927 domain-containing protein [Paracoccaceae bacterium]